MNRPARAARQGVARIARDAVQGMPGVVGVPEAGFIERLAGWLGRSGTQVREGQVHLRLRIVAEYVQDLPELAEDVRRCAARAVEQATGHTVTAVDVVVADLAAPGESEPGGSPGRASGAARLDF